ncbi:MAG: hypothetical protein AAFU79_07315 [Myxococcota bacterium]
MRETKDTDPREVEVLEAALDGSPERIARLLREHPEHEERLKAVAQALAVVDALPKPPSPELRPRLWARLEQEDARRRRWRFLPETPPWGLALGAVAVAALLFVTVGGPREPREPLEGTALAVRVESLEIVEERELYENLELIEHLDVLEDLAVIAALPEERG